MKYVIWGTGKLAGRLIHHMNIDDIICFVDTKKQIDDFCGKKVISLEKYEKEYYDYPIVISFLQSDEAVEILNKKMIDNYFLITDCPGEFQTSNVQDILKKHVIDCLKKEERYYIFGNNLYALLVYDWVKNSCNIEPTLLIDETMPLRKRESIEKIGYKWIKKDKYVGQGYLLYCDYASKEIKNKMAMNHKMKCLYDMSDEIKEYHNEKIERFKNIHNNKRCFIIATGPSLRVEDLECLQREKIITISMNQIWRMFEKTDWRPNYYIADDPGAIKLIAPQFDKFSIDDYFIGDTVTDFEKTKYPDNVFLHHFNYEFVSKRLPEFSEDFSRQCYLGTSVTYSCLQLAVYMGFKEIYLLGVDFSYGNCSSPEKYRHCYEEKELLSTGYPDFIEMAYIAAKRYADSHGIKIYNATRGGKLEVFERVDFDSLFEKK